MNIYNKNTDQIEENTTLIHFFLIMSVFLPLNMNCCLLILEIIEKKRLEKMFKAEDSEFIVNNPNCLTSLTQIDHAFLTKSALIDNSSFRFSGAIIKENFYIIDEEKLNNLKTRVSHSSPLFSSFSSKSSPKKHSPKKEFRLQLEKVDFESNYFFSKKLFELKL